MTDPTEPADWPQGWHRYSQDQRDALERILHHYGALLPGYDPDADAPAWQSLVAALEWQRIEIDVLDAHAGWLARTKALFERNGWPWTTAELLARADMRESGE